MGVHLRIGGMVEFSWQFSFLVVYVIISGILDQLSRYDKKTKGVSIIDSFAGLFIYRHLNFEDLITPLT